MNPSSTGSENMQLSAAQYPFHALPNQALGAKSKVCSSFRARYHHKPFLTLQTLQGRAQEFKRRGAHKPRQLTFPERRAFVLASTSAGLIFLKPSNDCGFLPIARVKLNSKILLQNR